MVFSYSKTELNDPQLTPYKVYPKGQAYLLSFGQQLGAVDLGVFYRKTEAEGEISHDGVSNTLTQEGSSFGLNLNLNLSRRLFIRVGHSWGSYKRGFKENFTNSYQQTAAEETYGVASKVSYSDFSYGAGLLLYRVKDVALFASAVQFHVEDQKELNVEIGLRFLFDIFSGVNLFSSKGKN